MTSQQLRLGEGVAQRGRTQSTEYAVTPRPLFWLFLVYLLFLYLQGGYRIPMLGDIRFEFWMGAILGPASIVVLARRKIVGAGSVIRWSVALLLCMALMVAMSKFPAQSWEIYWNRPVKFAIFGICIAAFVASPKDLRWFIGAFLLAFLKMGQEGLLGTLNGSLIWQNQEIPRLHGSTPNYVHPNSFSGTQLGTAAFLYYIYPLVPWYWRAVIVLQGIFCANVVLRTGSRTGYLGAAALVASLIALSQKRMKALVVTLLLCLVIVPLIPGDYLGRFESIFADNSTAGEDTSVGKRKEILQDATEVFARYPWGIGVGVFPLVRAQIFGRYQDTHNLYLEVATNMGVQGLLIFLGLVLCLWKTYRRLQKKFAAQIEQMTQIASTSPPFQEHLADLRFMLACARAGWIFLIIRLVLGFFGMDMYEVYWWFVAGLAVALLGLDQVAAAKTRQFVGAHGNPAEAAYERKPLPVSHAAVSRRP